MRSRAERGRRPRPRPEPHAAGAGERAGGAPDAPVDDAAAFLGQRYAAIYRVVRRIPRGHVLTYGQVAELAGMPGASRVVGAAMRTSSPELGLPWQRVVGKRGPGLGQVRIHDAMGAGMQRALLEAEGVAFTAGGGIALSEYGWADASPRRSPAKPPGPRAARPSSQHTGPRPRRQRKRGRGPSSPTT